MKKRLILLAGLGVGFVLGSRTGRQSYEKLKAQAQDLWTDQRVQDTVEKANQSIRDKSPAVADAVQTATDKVNAAAGGADAGASSTAPKPATPKPAASSAAGSTAPKPSAPGAKPTGAKSAGTSAAGTSASGSKSAPDTESDVIADPMRDIDDEGPSGLSEDT